MLTNKKEKKEKNISHMAYKYGQTDEKAALETTHSDLSLLFLPVNFASYGTQR